MQVKSEFTESKSSSIFEERIYKRYRTFKNEFYAETYLNIENPIIRKSIARLRLSSHDLHIETGRYLSGPKRLEPKDRLCKQCNIIECEDEFHFIMKCKLYENLRIECFSRLSKLDAMFDLFNEDEKFLFMISNTNMAIINILGKYVADAFDKRKCNITLS